MRKLGRCLSNFNQKLTKRNILLLWAGSEYLGNKQLTPNGTICQAGMFPFLLFSDIETGQKLPVKNKARSLCAVLLNAITTLDGHPHDTKQTDPWPLVETATGTPMY